MISISAAGQTGGEHCDTPAEVERLNTALKTAAARHVTVIAASGDIGAVGEPCQVIKGLTGGAFPPVKEVNLPAADPLVLATGGTSLNASHATGAYISETAWGLPFGSPGTQFQASGGGFSRRFARPGYQDGVRGIAATRGVPDVSADASPHTGMALVISDGDNRYTIRNSGGTSASAPLWAGLIALADQYAGRHLGFVNPAIYRIGRSTSYHEAFHDITTGNNTPTFPGHTIKGYTGNARLGPRHRLGHSQRTSADSSARPLLEPVSPLELTAGTAFLGAGRPARRDATRVIMPVYGLRQSEEVRGKVGAWTGRRSVVLVTRGVGDQHRPARKRSGDPVDRVVGVVGRIQGAARSDGQTVSSTEALRLSADRVWCGATEI